MSYPIFLSIILVVRNQSNILGDILSNLNSISSKIVRDYEIIVVDNASTDSSLQNIDSLISDGMPNLQAFFLTGQAEKDICNCVGLENALGDFCIVVDPLSDDINYLPNVVESGINGADVVLVNNTYKRYENFLYKISSYCFNKVYKWCSGIYLPIDAPEYRMLNRKVVNFILRHPSPSIAYRYLPITSGFSRINLTYNFLPSQQVKKNFLESISRAGKIIISSSAIPLRASTLIALSGALLNILYSIYIVSIAIFKSNVEPGWISLSLQQSGMFFLFSLVFFIFGEYILHVGVLTNNFPNFHIGSERTSITLTRENKLNIETSSISSTAMIHEK